VELEKNVSVDDVKLMVAARLYIYFEIHSCFRVACGQLVLFRQQIVDGAFKFKDVVV